MPHISLKELHIRRSALAERMPDASVLVVFSAELQHRNADVEYRFRQVSDFWYLTGLNTPESVYVMKKNASGEVQEILYKQPRDPEAEVWTGCRLSADEVREITGLEDIREFKDFESQWNEIFHGVRQVFADVGGASYSRLRHRLNMFLTKVERRSALRNLESITRTSVLLDELRLYKTEWEIEQMRGAADVSMKAHRRLASRIPYTSSENMLEGEFLAEIRSHDTEWAYMPIVASGENACTLHYVDNNKTFTFEGILVDAGAEYNYYAADITRVYPAGGSFTTAQRRVYELVLEAQKRALAEARKEEVSLYDLHMSAAYTLTKGLVEFGILEGAVDDLVNNGQYKAYFPHGLGHYIGLDVHDVGPYRSATGERSRRALDTGMAITVEPGLYFKSDDLSVPEELRGVGVRIEDDIVKTKDGIENLTAELPKDVQDIEDLVSEA